MERKTPGYISLAHGKLETFMIRFVVWSQYRYLRRVK